MIKESDAFKKIVNKKGEEYMYTTPDFLNKPVGRPRTDIQVDLEEALRKATSKNPGAGSEGEDRALERDMDKDKPYTGKYGTRNPKREDDLTL